ncbi:hypothetical protein Tco_1537072, partial [Tanacetum coccineum]
SDEVQSVHHSVRDSGLNEIHQLMSLAKVRDLISESDSLQCVSSVLSASACMPFSELADP